MSSDDLLNYIKSSRSSGLNDDVIKNALREAGWQEADITNAFLELNKPTGEPTNQDISQNISQTVEAKRPSFGLVSKIRNFFELIEQRPQLKYIMGVVLVIVVGFFAYKTLRPEKVAISQFELTAQAADAAGVNPDTTFILKSTADLDTSVVERYLSVEPEVKIKVKKIGGGSSVFEITPEEKLPENKVFAVKIEEGPIAEKTYSWAYQVKSPFQIIGTLPRDKGVQVPLNSGVEINFNRENIINPDNYFEISPNVSGLFEVHRNILVFVPHQQLQPETVYMVTVKKGIKIQGSGDTLQEDKVFKFETSNISQGYSSAYFSFDKLFWEFKPNAEPAFEINYYSLLNTTNLAAKVYRFSNVSELVGAYNSSLIKDQGWCRFNRYKPYQASEDKKIFEGNLSIENQLGVRFIRIPKQLEEGYYLLHVVVDNKPQQAWFQVTKTANYLAVTGTQSIVWLRSLDDGQPIGNAEIAFDGKTLGKTNSDGVAQFDTPDALVSKLNDNSYEYSNEPTYFYIAKAQGKELAIPIESRYGGFSRISPPDKWWDYLSLDKTIYQPNDTLRFWGIVRQRNGTDVRGEEITMQLSDPFWYGTSPNDITIYAHTKATISDFYTVTGEMGFAGLKPGLYQLSIKRGNEIIISENVSVETYIKPAYRLVLTPNKNAVFAGEAVNFKVKGEFFDGTPVSNLGVKYEGYLNGQIQGNVKLNKDGEGTFNVTTSYVQDRYWPKYLSITVSPAVSEEGEIAESNSVFVFGPNMNLEADQNQNNDRAKFDLKLKKIVLDKVEKGQPFWITDNYLGDPVPGHPINVEVIQITHKTTETGKGYDIINKVTYPIYTYSREEKSIRKDIVTTNGNGEAFFEQPLEKEKSYKIIFTTRDNNGRLVQTERWVWGGSLSTFSYYDTQGINLKNLDENKSDYKLGERIRLQAQDNAGNELKPGNRSFMFYRVVGGIKSFHISDNPNFEDTFKDEYAPNVNMVGVWFSGNRFHDSWPINISFASEDKRLNVSVKRNKDRYKPGEEVNLSIEVKDKDGKPKEAEINVSALDEAVFTLNPEEKDITNDLYKDSFTSLLTRSSHLTPLESGAERGGCFLPGTKIITSLGNKNIEDIKIGDYILTRENPKSSKFVKARVNRISSHLVDGYLIINNQLKVTENHRMFINNDWVKAGQINVGDKLLDSNGRMVLVSSIEPVNEWVWVHNFEVEGQHTYFADNFYVHNEEKGGGEARGEFKDVAIYKSVKTGSDGKANVSFKVPDNITSWRLTLQAISQDWFAGKATEFVPVGLPFFVETALNRVYLAGDNPTIRVRIFGTANIPDSINYKLESETLPFKSISKTGSKIEEFGLGQLTAGKHKIKISANASGLSDAVIRDIEVLNSYFTRSSSQYYDVSPSLSGVKGNTKGFTELLFTSQERGKLYSPLLSYLWSSGVRIDQLGSRYLADILRNRYFDEERDYTSTELRSYQTQNGGMALLPYSDDDLAISAKFADLIKGEETDVSREGLKDYFYASLKDKKTDLSRVVISLYGLAALNEPVLITLQNIKNDPNLTLMDKAFVAVALDTIGAKEEARQYYNTYFKPKLVNKKPYAYIDELKAKDDNIVVTAMLANLAGSLDEPIAESLATYAFENRPKETLIDFELLGYIKKSLPNLKGGDVNFSYKTNQKSENKTLKKDEVFRLVLGSDELATIKFENVNGRIGLISFFEETTSPDQLSKDGDISVRRTYSVDGRPTIEFKEGDLVKVELASTFSGRALPGLYQVTDYLPSGLRAVTRFNIVPIRTGECIRYPSMIEDQKVTFLDWNPKSTYCPNIFYYARVVTKGSYKAEPALIQSLKNLESLNISSPAPVIIK